MTTSATKLFRRICPTLIVADAEAAAGYYRDKFGFRVMYAEGVEFAIVDRDGCRIFLKRGTNEPSPTRNRHRCDNGEFYDLFIHFESMAAFDTFRDELLARQPIELTEISEWGDMRVFSANDLDGYKVSFGRSV